MKAKTNTTRATNAAAAITPEEIERTAQLLAQGRDTEALFGEHTTSTRVVSNRRRAGRGR